MKRRYFIAVAASCSPAWALLQSCSAEDANAPAVSTTPDASTLGDVSVGDEIAMEAATTESAAADVAITDAQVACSDERPQLSASDEVAYTTLKYLAAGSSPSSAVDNWDPTGGVGDVSSFTPSYTVEPAGNYKTIQSAVDAAIGKSGPVYIKVAPGTYREVVCIPANAPPITLYGADADASKVVIAYDNYNARAADAGTATNPCTGTDSTGKYGTAGSATFAAFAHGFQAKNVTFSNDSTFNASSGAQAVALMTQADRVVLDNVRILGHQDTFYTEIPRGSVYRVYVKSAYIAGDTDVVFGAATTVLEDCTLQFVGDRKTSGVMFAPSTASTSSYGFLVVGGRFTADPNVTGGAVGLGRSWDRSCVDVPTYASVCESQSSYPNGQIAVRESTLGAHIAPRPWLPAATTKRAYCSTPWSCVPGASADAGTCAANRFYEYRNTGPGSAH